MFDDSGTFPKGAWLADFLRFMRDRAKKITLGCNLRAEPGPFSGMARAGFRMVLVGIESANQGTLDRINKGTVAEDIIPIIRAMSKAGLEPHGAFITGYPWETEEDEKRTIELCRYLLSNGYLKTAQASVYAPPCSRAPEGSKGHVYLPRFYDAYKSPKFWINKLKDIRRWEDITYLVRGGRLVLEEKWRKACSKR